MHSKNRLWSCLNDLQVPNVCNGDRMGIIESYAYPLSRYVDDYGGIKPAP